jgi:hypothetical protein
MKKNERWGIGRILENIRLLAPAFQALNFSRDLPPLLRARPQLPDSFKNGPTVSIQGGGGDSTEYTERCCNKGGLIVLHVWKEQDIMAEEFCS